MWRSTLCLVRNCFYLLKLFVFKIVILKVLTNSILNNCITQQLCVTALGPSSGQLNLKNYKNKELLEFINHEVVKDIIPIIPSRILIVKKKNYL